MKNMLAAICLTFSFALTALAQDFDRLNSEEVKRLIDAGAKVLIVDARTEGEFRLGHVPGAVNVDPGRLDSLDKVLPKDKKKPVVFYCRNYG